MENKKQKTKIESIDCKDRLCPIHGSNKLKLRGRTFEGVIIKKFQMRVVIESERSVYIPKYERYEKRKTKIHSRLPDCLREKISVGDRIQVAECRPISKIVQTIVTKKISGEEKE
jgi:small subunit ribosomal protein S17